MKTGTMHIRSAMQQLPKVIGLLVTLFTLDLLTITAPAQSADALVDKLVQKGILSVKEANELKAEADKDFSKTYQTKSGLPDWVTSFRFSGDIRGRIDQFIAQNPDGDDRTRFRYRLRLGATATLYDYFEASLRLTSSDPVESFGGDPISGNTTFRDNGSKKFVWIDAAYGKWVYLHNPSFNGFITVGKMDNAFTLSEMVYDPDYTPEGFMSTLSYSASDRHKLKAVVAGFVLDELASNANDPNLLGGQLLWEAGWTPKVSSTLGLALMSIQNRDHLKNTDVPNNNRGNTRNVDGAPVYGFNPLIADAFLTYNLESAPGYRGAFPVRVGGEFMYNPAAPSSADNYAWMPGVTFGKAGKKGLWEFSYRYKWLGANSWWEELTDSDFGAYYEGGSPNDDSGEGFSAGTNVRGHAFRAAYSPSDGLILSITYYHTELIQPVPADSESGMGLIQIDAVWRF